MAEVKAVGSDPAHWYTPTRQPFRIILMGEKSSLAEVLQLLAQIVKGELILGSGEKSATQVAAAVARAALDGRRTIVLTFCDFNPSGWSMTDGIAHKVQLLRTLLKLPNFNCDIYRMALTIEQVRKYNLPESPLKESEKRAGDWMRRWNHQQTEIDALAALRPEMLREIALKWLEPFFDFSLEARCAEAIKKWSQEARARYERHPQRVDAEHAIEQAYEALAVANEELKRAQAAALSILTKGEDGISSTNIPIPEVCIEKASKPADFHDRRRFHYREHEAGRGQGIGRGRRGWRAMTDAASRRD